MDRVCAAQVLHTVRIPTEVVGLCSVGFFAVITLVIKKSYTLYLCGP